MDMSIFADPSAVAKGVLSPDQKLFATAGGRGECKVWSNLFYLLILFYFIKNNF